MNRDLTILNRPNRVRIFLGLAIVVCFAQHAATGAERPVSLGASASFAVLAATTVTSTGNTIIDGELGLAPGVSVTGFPPGFVTNGAIHISDAAAVQARIDMTAAWTDAAGRTNPVTLAGNIGGMTLSPGVYQSASSLAISSGDLILNAEGNENGIFIFQIGSTLTTVSGRQVILVGGAKAANIFWQVGSSATLGTDSGFNGTILAQESITISSGATLMGRAWARNGAVTLDSNVIVTPDEWPPPLQFTAITYEPDGDVILVLTNRAGFSITLEHSSDLTNWTFLSSYVPDSCPYVSTDATAVAVLKRFYKAYYPGITSTNTL